MAVIPRKIYNHIEEQLYSRKTAVRCASDRLMDARARASSIRSQLQTSLTGEQAKRRGVDPSAIHGSGLTSDPVAECAVTILEAEAALCTAVKWAGAFSRLDELFAGKPEADVAHAIYDLRVKQCDVADALHMDRQSVRRYRDTYVCHCALIAAQLGLIKITEDKNDERKTDCG